MRTIAAVLGLFVLASGAPAAAQDALVLGGGGARGLAHAGALVGLDERGYSPDLVVGTSMGAIIGALYAAGYSPDSIAGVIEAEDWQAILTPPPVAVGPDRRPRYPALRLGVDIERAAFSDGTVTDAKINRRLVQLLFDAGARSRNDFDRLTRRFRAVAADLRTGERVVMGRGDLPLAVRASMSAPGFFAPVARDGRVLVDGGVADYLPGVVADSLGAETVVAVDVLRPPERIEGYTPVEVGTRALRLLLGSARGDSARADVLVLPDLDSRHSSFLFPRRAAPLIARGRAAALRAPAPSAAAAPGRPLPPAPDSIAGLEVDAADPAVAALARAAFDDVAPGPYDAGRVLEAVDRLYATGWVDGVWPRLTWSGPRADGGSDGSAPRLRVRADAPAPTILAGAAGYDNDRGGRLWGMLRHRAGRGRPAEYTVAASLGGIERWGSASGRWASLRWLPLAWSAGVHARETEIRRFEGDDPVEAADVRRAGGWLGAERPVWGEGLIVAAIRAEYVDTDGAGGGEAVGPFLRVGAADRPTRAVGEPLEIEAELRTGAVSYYRVRARGSLEARWHGLRAAPLADLSVAGPDAPLDVRPALGDEHAIPGLRWGRFRGRVRAVGGIDLAWPVPLEGLVRLRLRAGAVADRMRRLRDRARWRAGAGIGALWWTPFGPIEAELGATDRLDWRFDVSVGARF